MTDWKSVALVLLGSWPSQVGGWGEEAIAAYCSELQARGITSEGAMVALRCWGGRFAPNAGELASAVRRDPSAPTFDEAIKLVQRAAMSARVTIALAGTETYETSLRYFKLSLSAYPAVLGWVEREGLNRLLTIPLQNHEYAELNRRELRESWEHHMETTTRRQVAALASGRNPQEFDPLEIELRRQIEA